MKKIVCRLMMLAAAMLPMAVAAQEENSCTLSVEWSDATGDGWVGNDLGSNRPSVLKFYQNNTLIDTLSPDEGYSGTMALTVAANEPLTMEWQSGDYDNHCSFRLRAANGRLIYDCPIAVFSDGETVEIIEEPCATCWPAYGMRVDSIAYDAVRLKWEATSDAYVIEIGDYGFTLGSGDMYEADTTEIMIEDLLPGMRYDVYLYSLCEGECSEPWMLSFITPGAPVEDYPYMTGFEPDDDAGWQVSNNINSWEIGSAVAADGDFSLYVSNDGGESNNYSDVITLSYAHRAFVIDEAGVYNISFQWRAMGDEYSDYLRVFFVPEELATFTPDVFPGTATNFMTFRNSIPTGWIEFNSATPRHYFGEGEWQTKQASVNFTEDMLGTYHLTFLWCNNQAENFGPGAAVDNVSVARNTCPAISDLQVMEVGAETVRIGWTAGGNEEAWQLSIDGGEWMMVDENPYTIEGLMPGTTYRLRLRAYCSDEDQSLYATMTATTECTDEIGILPYVENFNNYTPYTSSTSQGTMNPCWSKGYTGSGNYPYVRSKNGHRYLEFSGSGLFDYYSYAILPPTMTDIRELELTFDLARSSDRHNDTIIVALASSSDGEEAEFDTIATVYSTSNYFVRQRVRFEDYAGTYNRIALIAPPCYHNTMLIDNSPLVDNVNLHLIPNCIEPDDLHLVSSSETSLTLGWTATMPSAEGYVVRYRESGESEWQEWAQAAGTQSTIGGLEAGTTYEVMVNTYCSYGDTSLSVEGTFRTDCASIDEYPYQEAFATASSTDCWTMYDYDNDGHTWSFTSYDGTLSSSYNDNQPANDWAIMPAIAVPDDADGFTMSYQVRGSAYRLLLSEGGIGADDFGTVLMEETPSSIFATRTIWLDEYAGQTIRIAFHHNVQSEEPTKIDNIHLRMEQVPQVSIDGPTTVALGSTVTYAPVLLLGSVANIGYEWFSTMANRGLAEMNINADQSITISYTTVGRDTIQLMANNDYGDASAFVVVNIVDMSPITELPYYTGFEAGDDRSWLTVGNGNGWVVGNAVSKNGAWSLYISNDGGATAGYATNAASVSYAYRAIQLEANKDYEISFDWRAEGEGEANDDAYDYMRAFVVPANVELQAGVLPGGYSNTGDFAHETPEGWIALSEMPMVGQATWSRADTTVRVSSEGTYNIVFVWANDGEDGTGNGAVIDNLNIEAISCMPVANLHLTNATATSLTLSWQAVGDEEEWIVEVGDEERVATTTSITVDGLEEATYYAVSVRARCSEDDLSAAVTAHYATSSDCNANDLPWQENFATWSHTYSDNYIHPCWLRYYDYGSGSNNAEELGGRPYVCTSDAYSSNGTLMLYSSYSSNSFYPMGFNSVAVLPEFSASSCANGVTVSMSARFFAKSSDDEGNIVDVDYLEVGYLSNVANAQSFVAVDTIFNPQNDEFANYSINLPNYTAAAGRVALRYSYYVDGEFYYVAIDNIAVTAYDGPHDPVTPEPQDPEEPVNPNGIESGEAVSITLYPNPASDEVSISVSEVADVVMLDMAGRQVGQWHSDGEAVRIATAEMPRGAYFMRIVTANGAAMRKLVLQ